MLIKAFKTPKMNIFWQQTIGMSCEKFFRVFGDVILVESLFKPNRVLTRTSSQTIWTRKGCFLNLVPTFPLVNQWKIMSTITKNIQNWESFEGKWEKIVGFEENICHLSFNSRKGTKLRREMSKILEKITLFRRKM